MKPSQFTNYPWNCLFRKAECEIIAQNIMIILKRTGDTFRELTFEEYREERIKDRNFSEKERGWFEHVVKYCTSAEMAQKFSTSWQPTKND